MQIISRDANCYKVRNLNDAVDSVSEMIQGMRKRGVSVSVIGQDAGVTTFCIH